MTLTFISSLAKAGIAGICHRESIYAQESLVSTNLFWKRLLVLIRFRNPRPARPPGVLHSLGLTALKVSFRGGRIRDRVKAGAHSRPSPWAVTGGCWHLATAPQFGRRKTWLGYTKPCFTDTNYFILSIRLQSKIQQLQSAEVERGSRLDTEKMWQMLRTIAPLRRMSSWLWFYLNHYYPENLGSTWRWGPRLELGMKTIISLQVN